MSASPESVSTPPAEPRLVDLSTLPPKDQLRFAAFRLFSQLLREAPTVAGLRELIDSGLPAALAGDGAGGGLRSFGEWLRTADDEALEAARRDHVALFQAARTLRAPPWESVYASPDRMVAQEPARDALRAYAEAGVIFEGWRQEPADHISLELAFAAELLQQAASDPAARERLARFEARHLSNWVPRFCADLEAAASSPLYKLLASALTELLAPSAEA